MNGIESGYLQNDTPPLCGGLPLDFQKMNWVKHNGVTLKNNRDYSIFTGWEQCTNCKNHWQPEFDYLQDNYGISINTSTLKGLKINIPLNGIIEFEYVKKKYIYYWFKDIPNEYYYAVDNDGVPNGITIPFMGDI